MKHFNCHHDECGGFDVDVDPANITVDDFAKLDAARTAHIDSHYVKPEVTHIRKRINPHGRRGNGFYTLKLAASENGSQTLCGAKATVEDMSYGETRHDSGRAYVSCETCKQLRQKG